MRSVKEVQWGDAVVTPSLHITQAFQHVTPAQRGDAECSGSVVVMRGDAVQNASLKQATTWQNTKSGAAVSDAFHITIDRITSRITPAQRGDARGVFTLSKERCAEPLREFARPLCMGDEIKGMNS
jgi:hypothetical protein